MSLRSRAMGHRISMQNFLGFIAKKYGVNKFIR